MHFQYKYSSVIGSGWSQIEPLQHACACWRVSELPLPTQRSRFGLFCITWALLKVWFPLQPAALKVDALHRRTPGNVLTVLSRGTSCIFAHYAHCTLWFFRLLSVAAECVKGHLEGRWRAAALGEDDRVICQTGKGHEFTAPADLSACLNPRARNAHTTCPCSVCKGIRIWWN